MKHVWSIEEEARRLHKRFDDAKAAGIGQAQFARDHAVPGGASMLSQHIKGRRPMNLEAAKAYAKGFRCRLEEISPRLALEVAEAGRLTGSVPEFQDALPAWPLPAIPRERIEALAKDPVKLERLQGAIGLALAQIERGALVAPDQRSSSGAVHSLDDVTLPFDSDPNGIGQWKATTADEALSLRRISRAKDVIVNVAPGVAAANDKIEDVPELGDVRLAAGDGIDNHDEHVTGTVKFRRSFLRSVGADSGRGRVVYAKGDSMEPVIPDGSTLLFVLRPDMTIKDIATNSIYAINYDGKMVVKIVTQDRSGRWVARSANPAHADIDLESGVPVRVLGRVVWAGASLGQGQAAQWVRR